VLLRIPDDRRIAEAYSRGDLIITVPGVRALLGELWQRIEERTAERAAAGGIDHAHV
jgi:hypothetical protein